MIKSMKMHITEAELARDLYTILDRVHQGVEITIERGNKPVAILRSPQMKGRMISEVINDLKSRGSNVVIDEDFARDVQEGIKAHRQPWNPPSWD